MSAGIHSEFSRQLVTGCKGTILRLLDCNDVIPPISRLGILLHQSDLYNPHGT